ncbi:uncharacterized protein CPUR_05120 [Claviceps purpurea 20.1]|uniref:Uncharacterized protein n=1 Tax=Claviceps purpurea (strain 20.1) TaxID=1111077 RepID=M1WFV5_CLAP2|nr:uncharacterized protein CPUR_05120 [Claviceps purpurea 20.1]
MGLEESRDIPDTKPPDVQTLTRVFRWARIKAESLVTTSPRSARNVPKLSASWERPLVAAFEEA